MEQDAQRVQWESREAAQESQSLNASKSGHLHLFFQKQPFFGWKSVVFPSRRRLMRSCKQNSPPRILREMHSPRCGMAGTFDLSVSARVCQR